MQKCNTEQFIEKAIKVHGDLYDYSLVEYITNQVKVKIICKVHGVFEQRPNDHTSHKNGCNKCAIDRLKGKITLSQDEVIARFREIWNDHFDYSKFVYTGIFDKSIITCKIHGDIVKSANHHLQGSGCWECTKANMVFGAKVGDIQYITKEVFLNKAKEKHGDKFSYPELNFKDQYTEIDIKCNIHNITYKQVPRNHINNQGGCPKCKSEAISKTFLKSNDTFIREALSVHEGYYDYSKVNYTNSKNKVEIICPHHGVFKQYPNDHLNGHGCKKCGQKGSTYNITKAERNKEDWSNIQTVLYLIELKSNEEHYLKIGISNEKELRHSVLERVSKCKIVGSLLIDIDLYNAVIIEQTTLKDMKNCKYIPIHNYPGYTECFNLNCKNILEDKISYFLENNPK